MLNVLFIRNFRMLICHYPTFSSEYCISVKHPLDYLV